MSSNPINSGGDQSPTTPGALNPEEINAEVDYGISTLFRFSVTGKPEIKATPSGPVGPAGTNVTAIKPPVFPEGGGGPSFFVIGGGLNSLEGIREVNPALFDFGDWLASNKSNLVLVDVQDRIEGITLLEEEQLQDLWSKLYGLLSAKDYKDLTPAIVNFVRANNFLVEFDTFPEVPGAGPDIEEFAEYFQEVADASLVIPQDQLPVYTPVVNEAPKTYLTPYEQESLNTAQVIAKAGFEAASLSADLDSFRKVEIEYGNERRAAYAAHQADYQALVDPIMKPYRDIVDNLAEGETAPEAPELPPFPVFTFPAFNLDYIEGKACYGSLASTIDSLLENGLFCGSILNLRGFAEGRIRELQNTISKNSGIRIPKALNFQGFTLFSDKKPLNNSYALQLVKLLPTHTKYSLVITHFSRVASEVLTKITATLAPGTEDEVETKVFKTLYEKDGYKTVALFVDELTPVADFLDIQVAARAENGNALFSFGESAEADIIYYGPRPQSLSGFSALSFDGEPGINGADVYGIRKIGIQDYMRVEQEVCCYVPGEVSHIENVMAREHRKKQVRNLERTEVTTEESDESEHETSTDTTTTERHEIHKEISRMVAREQATQLGVTSGMNAQFKAGIADMGVNAGASFNYNNSTSTTDNFSTAETIAKEVTQKATERVVKKMSYRRTAKMLREHEEQNEHGFDNRLSGNHVTGIYRWVDKIYKNTLYNYGKRLQYEFMLPEPARNFKHFMELQAASQVVNNSIAPVAPVHPDSVITDDGKTGWSAVTRNNYAQVAGIYGADVDPCPEPFLRIAQSFSDNPTGKYKSWDEPRGSYKYEIEIPAGYYCKGFWGTYNSVLGHQGKQKFEPESDIIIDTSNFHIKANHYNWKLLFDGNGQDDTTRFTNDNPNMYVTKVLPVGISTFNVGGFSLNIVTDCHLSDDAYAQWQQSTYLAIMDAYSKKYQAYLDAKIAEVVPEIPKLEYNYNPGKGRAIEARELKRLCIETMTTGLGGQTGLLYAWDSYELISNPVGYRLAHTEEFRKQTSYINFLESAFEWELMSYEFLQYIYGDLGQWGSLLAQSAPSDPLFEAFLQSGMARLTLTVRPGYEKQVLYFLDTGIVPVSGALIPEGQQSVYTSISKAMKVDEKKVVGTPWETRIPTDLVILQKYASPMEQMGLPCVCTDDEAQKGLGIGDTMMDGVLTPTPGTLTDITTVLSTILSAIGGSFGGCGTGGSGSSAAAANTFRFRRHSGLNITDVGKLLMNDGDGLAKVYQWSPAQDGTLGQWTISLTDVADWNSTSELTFILPDSEYTYTKAEWRAGASPIVSTTTNELLILKSFLEAQTELAHLTFTITAGVLYIDEATIEKTEIESKHMPSYCLTRLAISTPDAPEAPTAFPLGKLVAIDGDYALISNQPVETYTITPGSTITVNNEYFNTAVPFNITDAADMDNLMAHIIVPGPNGTVQSFSRSVTDWGSSLNFTRDQVLGLVIASQGSVATVIKVPFMSMMAHFIRRTDVEDSFQNV